MINLYRRDDGAKVGAVTQEMLAFLINTLEEEGSGDTDYYIDADTIEFLKDHGASADLLAILKVALADRAGVEIYYRAAEAAAAQAGRSEEPPQQA